MTGLNKYDLNQSRKFSAQMELERRILHGMACEWEAALSNLEPLKRRRIRRPLFAIRDLKTQWGNWSHERREISLSRLLVLNYPWDSIRDVLLHETAHQIAQQMYAAAAEPSHGNAFKQACKLLRIDSSASSNYKPLKDRLLKDAANQSDKRMLRVKKLLALAESQNRFEAEAAMAKAHELIARYNIEINQNDERRRFISAFVGLPALRHSREAYHLANLLQDFYFVCGIWVPAYVIEKSKMGRVLEISGTGQNIKMAAYVYDFISQFIDVQWHRYNRKKGLNRYRKTDFAVGIIEGFRGKLKSNLVRQKDKNEMFALVKTGDPQLKKYFNFKYPHTASIKKTSSRRDARVLNDGKKVGQKLIIARGVCERKTSKSKLITKIKSPTNFKV
jgi:hypothetical protein